MDFKNFLDLLKKINKGIDNQFGNKPQPNANELAQMRDNLKNLFEGFKAKGLSTVALDQQVQEKGGAQATVGIGNVPALKLIENALKSDVTDPDEQRRNIKDALETMIKLTIKLDAHHHMQMDQKYVQDLQEQVEKSEEFREYLLEQNQELDEEPKPKPKSKPKPKISKNMIEVAVKLRETYVANKMQLTDLQTRLNHKQLSDQDWDKFNGLQNKHEEVCGSLATILGRDRQNGRSWLDYLTNNPENMKEFLDQNGDTPKINEQLSKALQISDLDLNEGNPALNNFLEL